jgi:hypothetical protein
VLRDVSPQSKP